jgi:hypothetical protein
MSLQPEMEKIKATFEAWRPEMEAKVDGLGEVVKDLRRQVDHMARGVGAGALGPPPTAAPPPMGPSPSSALKGAHSGQLGLGVEHLSGVMVVSDTPPSPPAPVTGQNTTRTMIPFDPGASGSVTTEIARNQAGNPPPHSEFPRFDGENPKLWKKACEKYFRIYSVSSEFWVEHATLHFTGNAALWFQSAEDKMGVVNWVQLCDIINTRFDRGQYQLLYRQAFKLKQTSSVSDYIERFDNLMHHMLAYKPDLDPTFFTTRFIDGLLSDIRAAVLIQQPTSLETAVSLALLQEEINEDCELPHSFSKQASSLRVNYKAPTLSSTSTQARPRTQQVTEDKRSNDTGKAMTSAQKFAALKAYRRAMNLCFKCGEKNWNQQHKCASTVQLHIVEELMEMLDGSESSDSFTTAADAEAGTDAEFNAISSQAYTGTENSTCFRLKGTIQWQTVVMLIDSGSSGNFISSDFATQLQGVQKMVKPIRVKVANGETIKGTDILPACNWACQGAVFQTDMKVIPLQCYDVILGIEWLKAQSPMHVDWQEKWIKINQDNKKQKLFGVVADTSSCNFISAMELTQEE